MRSDPHKRCYIPQCMDMEMPWHQLWGQWREWIDAPGMTCMDLNGDLLSAFSMLYVRRGAVLVLPGSRHRSQLRRILIVFIQHTSGDNLSVVAICHDSRLACVYNITPEKLTVHHARYGIHFLGCYGEKNHRSLDLRALRRSLLLSNLNM